MATMTAREEREWQGARHRVSEGTVVEVRRGPSSLYGNPSWWLVLSDGREYRTMANASVGYEVTNGMVGRRYRLALVLFRGAYRVVGVGEVAR